METRINKKGVKVYREMIHINGVTYKSKFSPRITDAKDWKIKMENSKRDFEFRGIPIEAGIRSTFEEYASDWLEKWIKAFKRPNTYRDYERILRLHLYPFVGKVPLKDIKITHADVIITTLKKNGKTAKGINDVLTLFKQVMNEAEKKEHIPKNPLRNLKGLKVDQHEHKFWSRDEINSFLLTSRQHFLYPYFVVAIYSGLRRGEIGALKWDCIDFTNNRIAVRGTRDRDGHRNTTKTGRFRYVPMNPFLRSVLQEHFEKRREASEYVFLNPEGGPINTNHIGRIFHRLREKAGIKNKIRFHDLRHTFASQVMMNKETADIYVLRNILGHTDVKMTQRYAHLAHDHLAGSTETLLFGAETELLKSFNPTLTPMGKAEESESNVVLIKSS